MSEPREVFVVTKAGPDGCSVDSVWSTIELAKQRCEEFRGSSAMRIEEFALDTQAKDALQGWGLSLDGKWSSWID